jgi:DNA-binding response OmpR family regulator
VPKILIIDYDPRVIKELCKPIEDSGYIVIQATDGRQGLLDYASHKPDLVIVEAMIPKRSGFELCQEIRKNDKDTPVIIISTVYKGRRYRSQAIHQCGATDFIEQPVDVTTLIKRIDELTDGARHGAQSVAALPDPVPVPPPAAEAPAATAASASVATATPAAVSVEDPTGSVEREIADRLDSILGD